MSKYLPRLGIDSESIPFLLHYEAEEGYKRAFEEVAESDATYYRSKLKNTDEVYLSANAMMQIYEMIEERGGKEYLRALAFVENQEKKNYEWVMPTDWHVVWHTTH